MTTDVRANAADISAPTRHRAKPAIVSASSLRIWHSYISAFITPTVVFFAFSGSLQILRFHEAHGSYVPSAFVSALGNIHKDQVLSRPERKPGGFVPPGAGGSNGSIPPGEMGPGGAPPGSGVHEEAAPKLSTQLLKGLFVIEAIALIVTTLLGTWIGITHAKRKRPFLILLGAGAALPLLLLAL